MNLFQVTWLSAILLTVLILSVFVYFWVLSNFWKWNKYKIPYVPGLPFLGNFKNAVLLKKSGLEVFEDLYNSACVKGQNFFGIYIFHNPAILIRDLSLIKKIFISDFNSFHDRFADSSPKHDPSGSNNLFLLKNPLWKKVRSKLSPFFTVAQIKKMFGLIDDIASEFDKYLLKVVPSSGEKNFEAKDLALKFTTEVIVSCAFGVRAFTADNADTVFVEYGTKMFLFNFKRVIQVFVVFFLPGVAKLFRAKFFLTEASNFIGNLVSDVIKKRQKSGVTRNDLIDIFIQMKKGEAEKNVNETLFTNDMLSAQSLAFFSGGFETTSTTIAFTLFELAKNPKIQTRLRQEIKEMLDKTKGAIIYDEITQLPYLEMVLKECLRLYPPLPFIERRCGVKEGYSMEPFDNCVIPYGMEVVLPVFALQRDPQYFKDPLKFDPERYAPENITENTLNAFYSFGTGPRYCIGERLGMISLKTGLVTLLKNHIVKLAGGQALIPKWEVKSVVLGVVGGLQITLSRDILYKM